MQIARPGGRAAYSRAEWLSDAAVHILGVLAALMAAPVLVTLAVVWHGEGPVVAAACIYAATLVGMLGASALYNVTYGSTWTGLFRRLDHTAIYLKIAGTYTPFAVLTGAAAGYLLPALWTAAAAGAALRIFAPHRFRLLAIGLCLAMGWAGIMVAEDLAAGLSNAAYALIVTGGLLYTCGVIFFLWERLPFHITIWHVMVLAATAVFYAALIVELRHGQGLATVAHGTVPPLGR